MKTWKRFLIFFALVGVVALFGAACGNDDSASKIDVIDAHDDGHAHATDDAHKKPKRLTWLTRRTSSQPRIGTPW